MTRHRTFLFLALVALFLLLALAGFFLASPGIIPPPSPAAPPQLAASAPAPADRQPKYQVMGRLPRLSAAGAPDIAPAQTQPDANQILVKVLVANADAHLLNEFAGRGPGTFQIVGMPVDEATRFVDSNALVLRQNLLLSDKQEVIMQTGGTLPIITGYDEDPVKGRVPSIKYVRGGFSLRLYPTLLRDQDRPAGQVQLVIDATQTDMLWPLGDAAHEPTADDLDPRNVHTTVTLKTGDPVFLLLPSGRSGDATNELVVILSPHLTANGASADKPGEVVAEPQ